MKQQCSECKWYDERDKPSDNMSGTCGLHNKEVAFCDLCMKFEPCVPCSITDIESEQKRSQVINQLDYIYCMIYNSRHKTEYYDITHDMLRDLGAILYAFKKTGNTDELIDSLGHFIMRMNQTMRAVNEEPTGIDVSFTAWEDGKVESNNVYFPFDMECNSMIDVMDKIKGLFHVIQFKAFYFKYKTPRG